MSEFRPIVVIGDLHGRPVWRQIVADNPDHDVVFLGDYFDCTRKHYYSPREQVQNFKDIVAHMRLAPNDPSIRGILRTIPSFAEDVALGTCLEQMMRGRFHIALVRNATGSVVGLVTLEDIMEELVGEIEDEYDRLPVQIVAAGKGWVVGGGLSLERLRAVSGLDLLQDPPPSGARTVSEWVTGHLPTPLVGGETVQRNGLRVIVRKVRRQKVLEAQVESRSGAPSRSPD